jgi:hypothetical protein
MGEYRLLYLAEGREGGGGDVGRAKGLDRVKGGGHWALGKHSPTLSKLSRNIPKIPSPLTACTLVSVLTSLWPSPRPNCGREGEGGGRRGT